MDYEFESIIPWNGEHDTGRDARQKLDRNFAKIKANFEELGDAKFVTTAFFARIFGIDGEDGAQVDINDTEAVITAVKVKFGLYSESFVSAKGLNNDSGSTPGGATTLAALTDVSITTTPKDGQVLAYDITIKKWKPVDMEATAGIDEAQLAQYLTTNNYAKKADITAALTDYALKTTRITAGTGLTGGGTLAQDVTLSLAAVGTAGTYTKVTVDSYGRVTGHSTLTQGDIPALAISKITGLQTALDAKLNKSVFEELFEKVWVSGYGYAIRAKLAFYSDDWISAKGLNSDAGSTTGGGVDEDEVLQIVENAGYATQDWVRNRGYLTSAALSGYLTQSTADGLYYHGHGETDDFNNAVMGGAYLTRIESWPDNGPSSSYRYGVLAVFYSGVDNARIGQLWMSHQNTGGIFARVKFDTNEGSWSAWRRLMDDTCIGSYALTPSNYTNYTVTKTGAGASGTWGIGISGNAATASVASKLGTATVGANNHAIYLLNGVPTKCTYAFGNYSGNVPISNGTTNANLSADMLDGKHGTDYYRIKEYNNVGIAKSMSSINATNASANAWNRADNASLFIQNSNNAFVVTLGGTTNDRNANIQVGHSDYTSFANMLGTLYLNRLGGAVCVGNPDTAFHHLNVGGGMYASSYVQIGSGRIYYDSTNNALYVQKSDGTQCGFYATGFVSAKGLNSDAGSTTGGGVDEDEVLQIVENAGYATQDWVRNRGYLTSAALSGYLTQSTADGLYYHGHGETDDFNNAVMGGAYLTRIESWPDNGPSSSYRYGVLAVFYSGVDNARIGQLWMSHQNTGGIFARVKFDTNEGSWSAWRRLMDDTCIGSYALTPSNYTNYTVTKTGAGASGTWGIGISGNAATASVASKLGTATVGANNHAIYLLNGVPTKCTYAFGNYSGNVPISNGTTNANLSADMLDGKHGTDYYRIKEYNNVGIAKSMSSINATNASANAWNRADNASLFIQNSNNAFVVTLGGTTNDRNANIQVGHSDYTSFANMLGTLYLNRLGGAVCVGNPDTAFHHLNVGGGMYASSYVQIGSGRIYYDSTNNALYVQKSDGTQCGFYATGFVSAKGANDDGGDTEATVLTIADERNTAIYPDTYAGRSIRGLFRANATDGLNDGGTYHTVLHIRQWADFSGGLSHQLAFTDNGGVWHRTATSETEWGEWSELSALSGLGDVAISSPINGQSLIYRDGVWKNETVNYGITMDVDWDNVKNKPSWIPDTDGSGSGIDADLLDGTHKSGLFTAMTYSGSTLSITIGGTKRTATINASGGGASSVSVSSSSSRNISVTVDGHTDYVNDVYATYSTYADQLRTARTIWGQSFNGGGSVSGAMSGVTNINMSGTITLTGGCTIHNNTTRGGIVMTYNGNDDGACLVIEADCVRRGWKMDTYALGSSLYRWHTIYAVNSLNTSSDLRLKDILSDIPLTVEDVAAAPSFLYRWKNSKDTAIHAGSAAQYWQKALPQAVLKGEDGYLSMEYDRLALAAVITTARAVVDHEQRIRKLEQQLLNAV